MKKRKRRKITDEMIDTIKKNCEHMSDEKLSLKLHIAAGTIKRYRLKMGIRRKAYTLEKKITIHDAEEMCKLKQSGKTYDELATIFDRSRSTVVRYIKQHNDKIGVKEVKEVKETEVKKVKDTDVVFPTICPQCFSPLLWDRCISCGRKHSFFGGD